MSHRFRYVVVIVVVSVVLQRQVPTIQTVRFLRVDAFIVLWVSPIMVQHQLPREHREASVRCPKLCRKVILDFKRKHGDGSTAQLQCRSMLHAYCGDFA